MTVLEIVKSKLSEPMPSEQELESLIKEVGFSILNYCNLKTVPGELMYVHANMVIDLINSDERKANPDAQKTVASIREGDTTVQYGSTKVESREKATEQLLFDYSKQLNRFRRLRW